MEKPRSTLERIVSLALPVVATGMIIYQMIYTQYPIQDPMAHNITHLGLGFLVVLLSLINTEEKGRLLNWGLLFATLAFTTYFMVFFEEIVNFRTIIPEDSDIVMGILVLIVAFILAYKVLGRTFVIVAIFSLGYLVFGRFFPPPFTVAPVSFTRIIMWLSAGIGDQQGVYGQIVGLSARYLFLLIVFGSMLYAFGGVRFILGFGKWVGSKFKSGPAAVAVIGSSLLGSMTGSTVANITITGSYTIPLMKSSGYEPEQAGAIEAAASNGGQILPPIMGATAFLMAGFLGIPYVQIAVAAFLPAILYYLALLIYCQINAYKLDIRVKKESINGKELLIDFPLFGGPLGVLVFLLIKGFSVPFVVFWSIVTLVVLALIYGVWKEKRLNFTEVVTALTKGARTACDITVVCALIGVVVTCIETSGLGIKLPLMVGELSHGFVLIALIITMISSIIVGMGVPTPAAYMLVAVGAAPALVQMGIPLLQAHLFPFIFAVFSHLTPPIAIGSLVASGLAGAKYWPTAWEGIKASFTAFLIPYFIIYAPIIILQPDSGIAESIVQLTSIVLAILALQIAFSSYFMGTVGGVMRVVFGIDGCLSLAVVFARSMVFLIIALALFGACFIWQLRKKRIITD